MDRNLRMCAFLLTLITATTNCIAASGSEIKVTGRITPGACTIRLTDEGKVDYGHVPKSILNEHTHSSVMHQVDYAITCSAPVKLMLSAINNRNTVPALPSNQEYTAFGIGEQNGTSVGHYEILHTLSSADGAPVNLIVTLDGGNTWRRTSSIRYKSGMEFGTSFCNVSDLTPRAYANYSGSLTILGSLTKSSALDFTSSIPIDGSSTLIISYL